jgi:hypothetical protein
MFGTDSSFYMHIYFIGLRQKQKQSPLLLVRKRNIPTEQRPPLRELQCQLLRKKGCCLVRTVETPRMLISAFYNGAAIFSFRQLLS